MTLSLLRGSADKQLGAPEVLRVIRVLSGQLEQAYALNEWDDSQLHALDDALRFLKESAEDLWRQVRQDRGIRVIRKLPAVYESPVASALEGDDIAQAERAMYGDRP